MVMATCFHKYFFLFPHRFSRFGQTSKKQWRDPSPPNPLQAQDGDTIRSGEGKEGEDEVNGDANDEEAAETPYRTRQKEKMRRELAAVFRLARSSNEIVAGEEDLSGRNCWLFFSFKKMRFVVLLVARGQGEAGKRVEPRRAHPRVAQKGNGVLWAKQKGMPPL